MQLEEFFAAIDSVWPTRSETRVPLRIIGSTALMLQTSYRRGTKDSDVLETADLGEEPKAVLRTLAGKGSPLHLQHRLYLDFVGLGLPFLPHVCAWHLQSGLNARLDSLEVSVLDVVDVVVSKMKRFSPSDVDDVAAMIELEHVDHARLLDRFRSAVDVWADGAMADSLPRYVANLNRVERDMFGVEESEIELPSWVAE